LESAKIEIFGLFANSFLKLHSSYLIYLERLLLMAKFVSMAEQLIELNVTGMHCNNCAMSIHKLLEKKGLHNILVDFAGEEVKFSTDDESKLPEVIKGIENLGFKVIDDINLHSPVFYELVEINLFSTSS
jgi:copper chaperone CopZ